MRMMSAGSVTATRLQTARRAGLAGDGISRGERAWGAHTTTRMCPPRTWVCVCAVMAVRVCSDGRACVQ